jgi:bifunctional DNase/RNase
MAGLVPRADGKIKMEVLGVYKVGTGQETADVVFLVDETKQLVLPIYIDEPIALMIQLGIERVQPHRPMTHDLIMSMLEATEFEPEYISIDGMIKQVYTATLHLRSLRDGHRLRIDSRPSDAIAVAVRADCEILADESLKEQMVPRKSLKLPDSASDPGQDFGPDDQRIDSPYGV